MGQAAIIGWPAFAGLLFGWSWHGMRLNFILTAAIALLQLIALAAGTGAYNVDAPLGVLLPLMFAEWLLTAAVLLFSQRKVTA